MAWCDPSRIFALFTTPAIPRATVVDGRIKPSLLVTARRAYWVQSRVLRVPDRFGFFSSGPPLLQAYQAHKLRTVLMDAVTTVAVVPILNWPGWGFETSQWFPGIMALSTLYYTIFVYVEEVFFNPMRAPDYNWEAMSRKMGLVQPLAEVSALTAGGGGREQGSTGSAPEKRQSDT